MAILEQTINDSLLAPQLGKKVCPECLGKRKIIGCGCIHIECPRCNGTGFIDEEPVEIDIVVTDNTDNPDIKAMGVVEPIVIDIAKKRGRPKKV